jgi:hypothetical protein
MRRPFSLAPRVSSLPRSGGEGDRGAVERHFAARFGLQSSSVTAQAARHLPVNGEEMR